MDENSVSHSGTGLPSLFSLLFGLQRNSSQIYPELKNSQMGCLLSSSADVTVADEELGEGAGLVNEATLKLKHKADGTIVFQETVGPLSTATATAEGLRLSELRRNRIMQTKPADTTAPTVTSNMFVATKNII